MKKYLDFEIGSGIGFMLGVLMMYFYVWPNQFDNRAHALDLYRYDSSIDKFVPKDSIHLTKEDMYYLKYGKTRKGLF